MTNSLDTAAVMERYALAMTTGQASLLEALVADDCVVEKSTPDETGTHLVGRSACIAVWRALSQSTSGKFSVERLVVRDEYALLFWQFHRGLEEQRSQRGLSVFVVRDGLIASGHGYVKEMR